MPLFAKNARLEAEPLGPAATTSEPRSTAHRSQSSLFAVGVPATSQAALLVAPRTFELAPQALRAPEALELLVRVEGCGICESSLPLWEGRPWFTYPATPGAPGHEGWGVVTHVGDEVQDFAAGDRVGFLCEHAYAEHVLIPRDRAVGLPVSLAGLPFPAESVGCALNIFRRSRLEPGLDVAIVGAGFLGLLLTELAASLGCRVFVLSRRRFARELALRAGAAEVFDTEDWWGSASEIVSRTDGRGCRCVIEATGRQFGLDATTEMVAEGGRLVVAGYHQDGTRVVDMQKWNWRGIDVINAHERDVARCVRGMRDAVKATCDGRIHPERYLTHRVPLSELGRGFALLKERPDGFVKAWVSL